MSSTINRIEAKQLTSNQHIAGFSSKLQSIEKHIETKTHELEQNLTTHFDKVLTSLELKSTREHSTSHVRDDELAALVGRLVAIRAEDTKDCDVFRKEALGQLDSIRQGCEWLQEAVKQIPAEMEEKALQYWTNTERLPVPYESETRLLLQEQNAKLSEAIGRWLLMVMSSLPLSIMGSPTLRPW